MTPRFEQEAPLTTGLHSLNESDYLHSLRAGLVVPLLQSVTIGMLVTIIASLILEYNGISDWFRWAALVGLSTILAFFLNGLRLWRYLVQLVERELHVDIDRDGQIGQPEPRILKVQVDEKHGAFTESNTVEFVDDPRLEMLAAGLMAGRKFTEEEWVGRQADGKFSGDEFRELRGKMLKYRWIKLRNPSDVTRGYILSASGRSVMEQLAPSPVDGLDNSWVRR